MNSVLRVTQILLKYSLGLLFAMLGISFNVYANPVLVELRQFEGKQEVWINLNDSTPDPSWTKFKKIGVTEKLPAHSKLFHWADEISVARAAKQGRIDSGEVEFLLDQPQNQLVGGGYYASGDAWDSRQYGPRFSVMEVDHPVQIAFLRDYERIPNGKWPEISRKLREQGVEGIRYTNSWYNFIDSRTLTQIRTGTVEDIYSSPNFSKVADVIDLDRKGLLQADSTIQKRFPLVYKMLKGESLTDDEIESLWVATRFQSDPPLGPHFRKLFHERLLTRLKARYSRTLLTKDPDTNSKSLNYTRYLREGRRDGLAFKEIVLDKTIPHHQFSLPYKDPVAYKSKLLNIDPFGENLSRAFEFIGYDDLMLAVAEGNSEPWRIYDQTGKRPLLDRWNEAIEANMGKNTKFLETYLDANRILTENPASTVRDKPIMAGGDIQLNGKGYFRITELEKKALEGNDLLISEIIPDPSAPPGRKIYLGRYEYPSAKNYSKFRNYISKEMFSKLEQAEKNNLLDQPGWTRRMLEDMAAQILGLPADDVVNYQRMLSLHPFEDYNGRTMRAIYQIRMSRPMFLRNWDRDLFRSPASLAIEVVNGEAQISAIREAMTKEYIQNFSRPKYYDLPVIWQVAAETNFVPKNPNSFVAESKAWYLKPESRELVRQKRTYEFESTLRNACIHSKLQDFLRYVP